MPTKLRHFLTVRRVTAILAFLLFATALWYWPQSPRWHLNRADFPAEADLVQPLSFSPNGECVFLYIPQKGLTRASVLHFDTDTGRLLKSVELWNGRPQSGLMPWVAADSLHDRPRVAFATVQLLPDRTVRLECFHVSEGKLPGPDLGPVNEVSYSLSPAGRWVHCFAANQHNSGRHSDLLIRSVRSGETVLRLEPEDGPAYDRPPYGPAKMVYTWIAVFDQTERYVALAWNSMAGFSAGSSSSDHQSQVRIYDLESRREIRRIALPPGHQWEVKSWEGNALWASCTRFEYPSHGDRVLHITSNRLDLDQEPPQVTEYPYCRERHTKPDYPTNMTRHHRIGDGKVLVSHTWMGKKPELPAAVAKLVEWFPSLKGRVAEYYPESGTRIWFIDSATGKQTWALPRPIASRYLVSPEARSLIVCGTGTSLLVEMWDTHGPRRWPWLFVAACALTLLTEWRERRKRKPTAAIPKREFEKAQ
jgi:hypothetical protein